MAGAVVDRIGIVCAAGRGLIRLGLARGGSRLRLTPVTLAEIAGRRRQMRARNGLLVAAYTVELAITAGLLNFQVRTTELAVQKAGGMPKMARYQAPIDDCGGNSA